MLEKGIKDNQGYYEYIKNKEKRKNSKREEVEGEASGTGVVNAFFVSLFSKQLVVVTCLMKLILIRG